MIPASRWLLLGRARGPPRLESDAAVVQQGRLLGLKDWPRVVEGAPGQFTLAPHLVAVEAPLTNSWPLTPQRA